RKILDLVRDELGLDVLRDRRAVDQVLLLVVRRVLGRRLLAERRLDHDRVVLLLLAVAELPDREDREDHDVRRDGDDQPGRALDETAQHRDRIEARVLPVRAAADLVLRLRCGLVHGIAPRGGSVAGEANASADRAHGDAAAPLPAATAGRTGYLSKAADDQQGCER